MLSVTKRVFDNMFPVDYLHRADLRFNSALIKVLFNERMNFDQRQQT